MQSMVATVRYVRKEKGVKKFLTFSLRFDIMKASRGCATINKSNSKIVKSKRGV